MMTRLNSASLESDRNRRVPLHGIRIAMGLAFLAAGAFSWFTSIGDRQWHEHHPGTGASGFPDPLCMSIRWIALPLVPFVLSGILLSIRSRESIAAGAGVAASLFACGLLICDCRLPISVSQVLPRSLRAAKRNRDPDVSCLQRLDYGFSLQDWECEREGILPGIRGNPDLHGWGKFIPERW